MKILNLDNVEDFISNVDDQVQYLEKQMPEAESFPYPYLIINIYKSNALFSKKIISIQYEKFHFGGAIVWESYAYQFFD